MDRRTWQTVRLAASVVIIVLGLIAIQQAQLPEKPRDHKPPASSRNDKVQDESSAADFVIRDVQIRNMDGEVTYEGDVDLTATLERIDAGKRLRFQNDGASFQNREQRLPHQRSGYYREWVHPTPGVSGPGPQRIVTGAEGEAYYTPDHYRTFQKLR